MWDPPWRALVWERLQRLGVAGEKVEAGERHTHEAIHTGKAGVGGGKVRVVRDELRQIEGRRELESWRRIQKWRRERDESKTETKDTLSGRDRDTWRGTHRTEET